MTQAMTQRLRFLFDPACPWAWRASRWIREAVPRRPIAIEWDVLSLTELNRERMDSDALGRAARRQPSLRLLVRAREQLGNDGIDRLYTTLGHAIHRGNNPARIRRRSNMRYWKLSCRGHCSRRMMITVSMS
jgi:hypothetical protein